MSFVVEAALPEDYGPFQAFRESLGFLPSIFRAQSLLPRIIEAEAAIASATLLAPGALTRVSKESILLAVAAAHRNVYCVTAHGWILRRLGIEAGRVDAIATGRHATRLDAADIGLIDFGLTLARQPTSIGLPDFEGLRALGWRDEQILEAILTTALTNFLCTLSTGLGVAPDFDPVSIAPVEVPPNARRRRTPGGSGPYLRRVERSPHEFPPFAFLLKSFGFIPNIFRAQTLKPEALEAEAQAIRDILLTEDVLTRKQKEYILLVISAANLNTYCVAVHCEMLRALGVPPDSSDRIAVDHRRSDLSDSDKILLDVTLKLATRLGEYGRTDVESLRRVGLREEQILEAIVMAALTNFLNTLQMGLGTVPDFRPRRDFLAEQEASLAAAASEKTRELPPDPDAAEVALAQAGDTGAFETLVRRHQGLVYRTLVGLTGNTEDAEDGSQTVFVKAFRKIRDFSGAARFSTWLTRIAINEGLERLRSRKPTESLSDEESAERFRPSLVDPWIDDPERQYAREEMRRIVHRELARLPALYRAAVLLRDIEQLSTAEAAAALEVPVATLKTRLLRGRLMMREALAAHFARPSRGVSRA